MTRELRIFSTIAVQSALETLVPAFEAHSGYRLRITWNTAPVLVKRLQGGETADVLILNRAGMDTMIREGRVLAGSEVTLASSATAIAIKAGAVRPDISTPEALMQDAARGTRHLLHRSGGRRRQRHLFRQAARSPGNRRRDQRQDEVSAAGRPRGRFPADRRSRSRHPAEARAAAGPRHRDPGHAARRPAYGHGLRRRHRGVERPCRNGQGADRRPALPADGRGLPRQGT